ncbi:hypothetical protein ACWCQZ_43610 [Streptomyces sp. NPDC002285]|uniref:hypothetical protein n=1 Tax=Streptomyces sp. NPDC056468 TaxID=3345830 RepID=UPI00369AC446
MTPLHPRPRRDGSPAGTARLASIICSQHPRGDGPTSADEEGAWGHGPGRPGPVVVWLVAYPLLGNRPRIADGEQTLDNGVVPVAVVALFAS